jgi:hypothetical protein
MAQKRFLQCGLICGKMRCDLSPLTNFKKLNIYEILFQIDFRGSWKRLCVRIAVSTCGDDPLQLVAQSSPRNDVFNPM